MKKDDNKNNTYELVTFDRKNVDEVLSKIDAYFKKYGRSN